MLQTCVAWAAPSPVPAKNLRAKLQEARNLFHQSHWREAIGAYSTVIKSRPNDAQALTDRGICYCRIKEFHKALSDFNAAIKIAPQSARAYQHRGYTFNKFGKFENTVADETKSIALNPRNRFAYRDRARAYAQLGKLDLAQKDFAVQQKLDGVAREYDAAINLQQRGKLSDALALLAKNERQNPGVFNPNYRRALIYTKLGMYAEAIAVCNEYIKERPKTFEGRRLRAINYLQTGDFAKANIDADEALKLNPDSVDPYYVKARAAIYGKNYSEAIKYYSSIIRLEPEQELQARMERADAYTELGDYAKAIADYDFLEKAEPKTETLYHHRAAVYLKMHNFDKAIADLRNFVKLAPKDAFALMSLGDGLYQARRYSEAVDAYSQAIKLDDAAPTLYELRARAYDKCNQSLKARTDRERAIKMRDTD